MMTGYVIIVRHKFKWFDPASWLSWAIRTLDKSHYNHVGILWEYKGQLFVVEARGKGIFPFPFNEWILHRPDKTYAIGSLKDDISIGVELRILNKFGTRYDNEGLFIWHPYRLLSGKWKGGTAASGNMVCSEFVAWCYKEVFPKWYKVTTGDIVRSNLFDFSPEITCKKE
jgi:hypothetical protein